MNRLNWNDNDLVLVDYSDLLDQLVGVLQNPQLVNPFRLFSDRQKLQIDLDSIAAQVADLPINNPLGSSTPSTIVATINFTSSLAERFPVIVTQLKKLCQQLLESTINPQAEPDVVKDFIASLITELQSFQGKSQKLDFTYPFPTYENLQKQQLSFSHQSDRQEVLKLHKLTITVDHTQTFNQQLQTGLTNYINLHFADPSDREELGYILEELEKNPQSDFYILKRIVDSETLGKLKKQAQINYLEFLQTNIKISSTNSPGGFYLQDLIRRLKLINDYISDLEKGDGYYQVNYGGITLNYRDWFARSEAFEMLPIVPIVEGYLGESTSETQEYLQFIFGLKLKFNNPVQSRGGKTPFEYYLNIIDPKSQTHQAELNDPLTKEGFAKKVLRLAFLYYFIFATVDPNTPGYTPESDLEYNPIPNFETRVLPLLQGNDDGAKQRIFAGIKQGMESYQIGAKIEQLKHLLRNVLSRKTPLKTQNYPLHISIKKGILEQDFQKICDRDTFFKPILRENAKDVLKYIAIGDAHLSDQTHTSTSSLCTLTANITISDIPYFTTDIQPSFSMNYDLTGINTLPIVFVPKEPQCQKISDNLQRKLILFPYSLERNNLKEQKTFVYQFTFALLAYLSVQVILSYTKNRLFIPILRLHLNNKQNSTAIETFMVSFSKVLSHLLNEEHRANAQGVDISGNLNYKIPNVLSSLYSILPKKFHFNHPPSCPDLNQLAIIIVSSRASDARWGSNYKKSNLIGEIVGLKRIDDGVRVQLLGTFSGNYNHEDMFRDPTVVRDKISQLYRLGYRHFLYIAKAPYTSTLHMTKTEDDDGLFFMSPNVIRTLKASYEDIKIYPIFFDKYYVVMLEKLKTTSLYIQDTLELTNLVADRSKKSVVFFNLFNGLKVGKDEERNYRGVISYATLLEIYQGILDDEDIRMGLISNTTLKNDILQYLTLFHFSRYEKARDISLKLDPYENLIGDDSVGKLSLLNQMRGKKSFNLLAFLTEVKRYL